MADFSAPIFSLKNISLHFGLNPLFDDLTLHIKQGDKICLIGRNGSGKSTLLKVIAGLMEVDSGEVFSQPAIKVAYMDQESNLSGFKTLKEYICSGLSKADEHAEYKADILIDKLDINANQDVATASGGEKKKASLAHALIQEPDILLLDEPTNHLDIVTIEKLEEIIQNFSGAVVVISHDRRFLTNISTATIWLDRGSLHVNDKGYAFFNEWQEEIINQEIIEQKNLNKRIQEETEWLHKGVTARRKRNMGRLRRLQQLRLERRNQIKQTGSVKLEVDKGAIQSKMISEAKRIFLIGSLWEAGLVNFLGHSLNFVFQDVHVLISSGERELFEQIMHAHAGDVAVVFAYSKHSSISEKMIQFFRDAGVAIVAITNSRLSPIGKLSDVTLVAKSDSVSFVDSLVAPLSVVNVLLVALSSEKETELQNNLDKIEHIWEEYHVNEK